MCEMLLGSSFGETGEKIYINNLGKVKFGRIGQIRILCRLNKSLERLTPSGYYAPSLANQPSQLYANARYAIPNPNQVTKGRARENNNKMQLSSVF